MVEVKAGQWWTDKGSVAERHRILVRGLTRTGKVIVEWNDGKVSTLDLDYFLEYKEHLPECTSFEWVPEVYPQYRETYMPNVWAFVRLDTPSRYTYVRLDGTEDAQQLYSPAHHHISERAKLTEAEALARIVKPEPKIVKPKPKTRTVKVHTVAYGTYKLNFVSMVLDTELDGVKRDWEVLTILKTEEFEVPCE